MIYEKSILKVHPSDNVIAALPLSGNTRLYQKMQDIIDINTGTIIEETIEPAGERILEIKVASEEIVAKPVKNG